MVSQIILTPPLMIEASGAHGGAALAFHASIYVCPTESKLKVLCKMT